jgi:hypothetical protein
MWRKANRLFLAVYSLTDRVLTKWICPVLGIAESCYVQLLEGFEQRSSQAYGVMPTAV